jgi:hypothetical protein
MTTAPYCPTSYSQVQIGRVLRHSGLANGKITQDPRSRVPTVQERIAALPRATDLISAIHIFNQVTNIVMQLTLGAPQVNNTYIPSVKNKTLEGEDNNPNYGELDWIEEQRVYTPQQLVNPDDPEQFIEIKVLSKVIFRNPNEDASLIYKGPL